MGYSLFNDVMNNTIKAFNRAIVIRNIKRDLGLSTALEYIRHFNEKERLNIALIFTKVKKTTWADLRREINNEVHA